MAEEDIIFGKNRHMFGGIEPSNMLEFATSLVNGAVNIKATLPNDTVINGQTLCTVAGAVIRKKIGSYPVDEFDGEYVADINISKTIIDSSADITTDTYYSAFPYSTQGVYNRNPANRFLFRKYGGSYLYGYDLDTTDSNPDTRVTYPTDVDNYRYTPASMNFTSGVFNYGSWPSKAGSNNFMPKPCMLAYDGTIQHYLNPNDYTKQVNGSDSYVATPGSGGNAMMEWPKIYTHRWMDGDIYKFRCSNAKLSPDYDCWDQGGSDHFYTAIYDGSYLSSNSVYKLRSISNNTVYTKSDYYNNQCKDLISYAEDNGSGWGVEHICHRLLIQDLLVLMSKTTDCQTAYGTGVSYEHVSSTTGCMNDKGLFWGTNDGTTGVKVFGMEQWWNPKYRRFILGFARGKDYNEATIDSEATNINESKYGIEVSGGYQPLTNISSRSGYIKSMFFTKYGRLPIGSIETGSGSTYEADTFDFYNASPSETYLQPTVAYIPSGDVINSIQRSGPFTLTITTLPAAEKTGFGASLSYIPPTT